MTRTQAIHYPPPGPQVQEADDDQVVRWIGVRLMAAAPEGWQRIDLTVRLTSTVEEIRTAVVTADGGIADIPPQPDVSPLLFDLRHKMYVPDRGTWLSLRMHIEPTGSYYVHYNFDLDPLWDPPVPADTYTHDLEAFPRADEWVPRWGTGDLPSGDGNAILLEIADWLKFALPVGWHYVQLQHRTGDEEDTAGIVHTIAGGVRPWTPPAQVGELLRHHRATAVHAWQSLRFEMRFPESVKVHFNDVDGR